MTKHAYVLTRIEYGDFDVPYNFPVGVTLHKETAKAWADKGSEFQYIRVMFEPDIEDISKISY